MHGRGADSNTLNRFDQLNVELEPQDGDEPRKVPTRFYRDDSKTILAENNSPDVGFRFSLNPYRGCEHGCSYCYARPSHEYLSFSAGLDFETRIMVKDRAPELLREKLSSRSWQPQVVALSGNTDCYQPVERKLEITRRCLQVFADFGNPVSMITKSDLVMRDIDILKQLAAHDAVAVNISVTSLSNELAGKLEPRASRPQRRLKAVAALAAAGIPVGVLIGPVIPGLNDAEIPAIVAAAASAGAQWAGWVMLRLAPPLPQLFDEWLEAHYPERRMKVWSRIRDVRGGKNSSTEFGQRMVGQGEYAQQLQALFYSAHKKHFGDRPAHHLSVHHFRKPVVLQAQLKLF